MDDTSPEESLDELRSRAEQDPTNYSLRFEVGQRLYAIGSYSEAVPHLQVATRHPHYRKCVLELLGETFSAKGMPNLFDEIGDDDESPPDEENEA